MSTSKRGFASMDPAKQAAIASKGGKAAHLQGTAHEFTSDEARKAGRKGGLAVSAKRARQRAENIAGPTTQRQPNTAAPEGAVTWDDEYDDYFAKDK